MDSIGKRELIILMLEMPVVFGAKKLLTVGSDLGHAVGGFKKAMSEDEEEPSSPPKQIRSEGPDAEFPEIAKSSEAKTERRT